MSVIGTATSGMAAAIRRFDAAATSIARPAASDRDQVDIAKAAAEIVQAKVEFAANVAVKRTGSRSVGSLVDILA